MKIYHYHPFYKYFICDGIAQPSPLDPPGVWLVPAHATDTPPPEYSEGFISVFNNDSWEIIEDKRGIYYSIITQEEILNDNPHITPENTTKEKPPEVLDGYILEWDNQWILKENKLPETPEPIVQNGEDFSKLTPEEKLQKIGLSIDDLKTLLGI